MWKASEGATRDSPLRTRRRESIWAAGHEERLARVVLTILAPWRRLWRRRMAGGELRLGTDSIYMGTVYVIHTKNTSYKYYKHGYTNKSTRRDEPERTVGG